MVYVVKRIAVRYDNGTYAPEYYFKGNPLGLFNEMTTELNEAKRFTQKQEATETAKALGRRFYVTKID